MSIHLPFENTFARLPDRFFARQNPVPVTRPHLFAINTDLATELGLDPEILTSPDAAAMFAGNAVPAGAEPIAQVYAAHQFGGWVPQLGDGRAVLLGELIDKNGHRRDIQLKGSGRTPFSRNGDGRAWLGPVMREYLVSEAMHALGIPTTRALAAVTTGEPVQRETVLPGAVLTRVAASHIRVGTFQYFAARQDTDALQALFQYVAARHFPDAESPLDLLEEIVARQASLIAKWMSVGFIHGVMNTDNMAVSGETIDYGPCAFMDRYHPETVYSSIDQFGRYAYRNQPEIAVWNLAQLASSLLPLMGEQTAAVTAATAAIHRFPDLYTSAWQREFAPKIGLTSSQEPDRALIQRLLDIMARLGLDFTNTFRALAEDPDSNIATDAAYTEWHRDWKMRLARESADTQKVMRAANPAYIARNHRVEQAIQAGLQEDFSTFDRLNTILKHPFDDQPENSAYRAPPKSDEVVERTFCGT